MKVLSDAGPRLVGLRGRGSGLKERSHPTEELLLKLADLDRMDLLLLGQLGDRPALPGRLQGLEGGRVMHANRNHVSLGDEPRRK